MRDIPPRVLDGAAIVRDVGVLLATYTAPSEPAGLHSSEAAVGILLAVKAIRDAHDLSPITVHTLCSVGGTSPADLECPLCHPVRDHG